MAQMYRLIELNNDEELGMIDEEQVQFLIDSLEEEGVEDQDYYIDHETLDFLDESGCDEELMAMLSEAIDGRQGIDIRYEIIGNSRESAYEVGFSEM